MNSGLDKYIYAINPCTVFSITLISACVLSIMKYKYRKVITPVHILFAGTFITGFMLLFPIYEQAFGQTGITWKTVLVTVHHTIRLFVVDADYQIIQDVVKERSGIVADTYAVLSATVFVMAPLLTFEFILSFFKNFAAYRRYWGCFWRRVYVFSELNDRSITLARSLKKSHRWATVVFTDVFDNNEEATYELIEKAKGINAICFKKDIVSLRFGFHMPFSPLEFFVIGSDESENLKQALTLVKRYGKVKNSKLYVFSTCTEGAILLSTIDAPKMKVVGLTP